MITSFTILTNKNWKCLKCSLETKVKVKGNVTLLSFIEAALLTSQPSARYITLVTQHFNKEHALESTHHTYKDQVSPIVYLISMSGQRSSVFD